ncbi:Putative multidrug resistance efflux transporter [Desulfonispora thiosulfatigenes DSM 11270]|uniref:Putative multidrug resistance efflux transporter n=1 Tax=Desulfonispora thiosulfatigenes DSM 11270 TaxID=656914 RepID=A0A1W1UVM1_DESTI|nr:multidrug resistance efflux transporter family protein [Desulfonispora thiosulfatigenes]SMB85029.1 Putative multidrug resistance efflux transporter [Desulfonispora thiosulfatigenes DSM 11270]
MKKSLLFGIFASFFFAFTFILNRQMNLAGGSWVWSASLRYLFMFPILFGIVRYKNELREVYLNIKENPVPWFVWSTVGFGFFYAPLCLGSTYGASWMVAGTWQITIIAGALLTPLFYTHIQTREGIIKKRNELPKKGLIMSIIILAGIFLIQFQQAQAISLSNTLIGIIPVVIAAFSYPLGNRKMMEVCGNRLNTFQRVYGMTLCSLPFWLILSSYGIYTVGLPSHNQVVQSLIVAIFSGVIATILFFKATEMVRTNPPKLAAIEATQSAEIIFALLGEVILLGGNLPNSYALFGMFLVILGMILNSLTSNS